MKMKPGRIVAWFEVLMCGAWVAGSDLAGAVLVPWVWTLSVVTFCAMTIGALLGVHKHPVVTQGHIKDQKVFDPTRIAVFIVVSATALVKSHPALTAANLIALVVFTAFIHMVKEQS